MSRPRPGPRATTPPCHPRTRRSCAPAGPSSDRQVPRHPVAPHAARPPGPAGRGVPRRAAGAARRHLQGALQRHRLPLPPRHRPHVLLRQPDHRRGAGRRGRRVGALRPAPLLARDRRVLPGPPVRRPLGRASAPPCPSWPTASASRCATSPSCPTRWPRGPKTRVHRGVSEAVDALLPDGPDDRRRARPGGLRDAAGQGRLGGRAAPGGVRHHHPGLRGLGARVGPGARARRALDRGHLLPPGPGDGQRHRLRLDRGRRVPRDHPALDRQHRTDRPRRAGAAGHGRGGAQPLHRRRHPHPAGLRHLHPPAARPLRAGADRPDPRHRGRPPGRCRSSPPTTRR